MSPKHRNRPEAQEPRGSESMEEEPSGGTLEPDPELEAALRDAVDAVESHRKHPPPAGGGADLSPAGEAGDAPEGEVLLKDELDTEFVEEEVERLRGELTSTKDQLLRLQADFENFRRRALKDRQEAMFYGYQNLVKDLLSTVDNLDRAIDHARLNESADLENLLQGVELVRRDLLAAMANHGVTEIEALGKPFDPAYHEAMGQVVEASVSPNTVLEVLQKGYRLRDRMVRPARVVVAKAPEGATESGGEGGGR